MLMEKYVQITHTCLTPKQMSLIIILFIMNSFIKYITYIIPTEHYINVNILQILPTPDITMYCIINRLIHHWLLHLNLIASWSYPHITKIWSIKKYNRKYNIYIYIYTLLHALFCITVIIMPGCTCISLNDDGSHRYEGYHSDYHARMYLYQSERRRLTQIRGVWYRVRYRTAHVVRYLSYN